MGQYSGFREQAHYRNGPGRGQGGRDEPYSPHRDRWEAGTDERPPADDGDFGVLSWNEDYRRDDSPRYFREDWRPAISASYGGPSRSATDRPRFERARGEEVRGWQEPAREPGYADNRPYDGWWREGRGDDGAAREQEKDGWGRARGSERVSGSMRDDEIYNRYGAYERGAGADRRETMANPSSFTEGDAHDLAAGREGIGTFQGHGPRGYHRSDERICEDVCEALSQDPYLDASSIEVTINHGVITLEGEVTSRQLKHRAENCADACSGVKDIENHLRVNRQAGTDASTRTEPEAGRSHLRDSPSAPQGSGGTTV